MNGKRVLSVILSICMVLSMLPANVLASTEQCAEFTVASLRLENQSYSSSTTVVNGVADGEYVIYVPAYGMALSSTYNGYYNNGVAVTEGKTLSGYGDTEIWTVTNNDDGTIFISIGGKKLGMNDGYSAMPLDATNVDWVLEDAGDGLYYVKNVARGCYIEWYNQYSHWNGYAYINDGTEGMYALKFYNVNAEKPEFPKEPELVDGYYEIYNADQLYWFAAKVNGGSTSINGKLMSDIVINEKVLNADGTLNGDGSNFRVWTPIGNSSRKYTGTFDGNDKTISGLYFNDTSKSYVGLFGYVGSMGAVKNVGVVGSYLKGYYYVGGVVGNNYGSYATVSNSYNTGSVSGSWFVGGVVGYNYSGAVSNSYNTGSVSGDDYVGGVAGCNPDGTVSNSYNTGSVSGDDYVGGVAGFNTGTVSNSYNTGSVSVGFDSVGGVVGFNSNGTISNCYNTGSVSGDTYVGGVVGYHVSTSGTVTNCYYRTGCAKDGSNKVQFGIGCETQGSNVRDTAGATAGKTADAFASGEVAYLLQGSQANLIWGQSIGIDPYPVLGGAEVLYQDGIYFSESISDVPSLVDGSYQIYTADQLYWFAQQVNGGNTSINGKLMANITVNESVVKANHSLNGDGSNFRVWTPIGLSGYYYNGVFDGNEMTIFGLYINDTSMDTADFLGLFGYVGAQGVVKNLTIADSYMSGDISGNDVVGGFAGRNLGTIENCCNMGTISNYYSGGVVYKNDGIINNCCNAGYVYGYYSAGVVTYNRSTITNCYNVGNVDGGDFVGGIVAYNGGEIENCFSFTGVGGETGGAIVGGYPYGTVRNSYYLTGTAPYDGAGIAKTQAQFASGEVAYLLGEDFGQTIGVDKYPVLGDPVVYKNQIGGCTSSTYVYEYSNTAQTVVTHNWNDATCTKPKTCSVCGETSGSALGHKWNAATCTDPQTCTRCSTTQGSSLGHSWANANCTKPKTCTTCGETSGVALGHSWEDATCTKPKTCSVCGETSGVALGHKWNDATCTKPKTCSVCGAISGVALGHRWNAATCTEPKTCKVCGTKYSSALGHSWNDATCTKPKTCTTCGETSGVALGHSWEDATCIEPKTCKVCGTQYGSALGHIEVVIPGYAATYDTPGLTDGSYCSRCGETVQEQQPIAPIAEEVTFSYKAYGINGSANAVNSGYVTLEIWMNINSDMARLWAADVSLSFNENLTLMEISGGIFAESLATQLDTANAYHAVKLTQDMGYSGDKVFSKGQYLFATLTFKVDKGFCGQKASFLIDDEECTLIRMGAYANALVSDFGTGVSIHVSKLGDADLNGRITAADTMALSAWFQTSDLDEYNAVFDLNKDGYIDGDDFALLRGAVVWDDGYLDT